MTMRLAGAAMLLAISLPSYAQDIGSLGKIMENMLAVEGVATIIYGEQKCDFQINPEALNRYLEGRGMLTPDFMAQIQSEVDLDRMTNSEVSATECSMRKATAEKIGVLATP